MVVKLIYLHIKVIIISIVHCLNIFILNDFSCFLKAILHILNRNKVCCLYSTNYGMKINYTINRSTYYDLNQTVVETVKWNTSVYLNSRR